MSYHPILYDQRSHRLGKTGFVKLHCGYILYDWLVPLLHMHWERWEKR